MSDGGFLGIQPTELKVPFELKKQSSCSMQLTNKTDQYVAFKVKTTNSKKYCVRSNTRIVLPRSTCDVTECHNRAWCNDLSHNLRNGPNLCYVHWDALVFLLFNFGCVIITCSTNHQFNKEPGKVVDEFKLRVTYVPAGPPSPVPEEPEEGSSTLETGFIVYKHKILYQDLASRQRRSLQRLLLPFICSWSNNFTKFL
ncbi:unnamed protein product [Musa hybrid cultivar]